jgi:hypothetical protein
VLPQVLRASFPASAIKSYPDVFYVEYFAASGDAPGGDLFFFDYGVVACWGLDSAQVRQIIAPLIAEADQLALLVAELYGACLFAAEWAAMSPNLVYIAVLQL